MAQYEIAGLRVELNTFGRTLKQAEPYLAPEAGAADFKICCNAKQILKWYPHLETLDLAEYMGTGGFFAQELLKHEGFQLHASAVALDGRAYLFSAPSGTGKSTHTQRWCRMFGARYINDDKPALRCVQGQWMVYGTPWSGKHDLSSPEGVPLGAIAFLERGEENRISLERPEDAVPLLFSQCVRSLSADRMERQLALTDRLLGQIPFYHFWSRDDDESALCSKEAMAP